MRLVVFVVSWWALYTSNGPHQYFWIVYDLCLFLQSNHTLCHIQCCCYLRKYNKWKRKWVPMVSSIQVDSDVKAEHFVRAVHFDGFPISHFDFVHGGTEVLLGSLSKVRSWIWPSRTTVPWGVPLFCLVILIIQGETVNLTKRPTLPGWLFVRIESYSNWKAKKRDLNYDRA